MGVKSFGLRHALLMGAAAFGYSIGAAAVAQPAYAQQATRAYDIPAQDLDDALREFGRQTGRDVLFTPDAVANKRSLGVRGQLTEAEALQTLLNGSGLRFEQTASGGYAVQDPNSPTRLGDASGAASSDDSEATAEILVTGRATLNADIRRSEDDAQPYVVFSSDDIEASGATTVEDLLQRRLPMNTQHTTASQTTANGAIAGVGNDGLINLRGLGANQTLILVDGRRLPAVSDGNVFAQPNISGIPPSAIDRIEILPATAGGIYGGSATGGVINIILKRDYSGLTLEGAMGDSFNQDVPSRRLAFTGGWNLNGGRTRVFLTGSHQEENALQAADRNFIRRARERFFESENIEDWFPIGNTPNITTFGGGNLVLDNGTPLNSTITFVPNGYAGPSTDGGAALVANAGHFNLDAPGVSTTLTQRVTRDSGDLTIRHEFTGNLEAYLDYYRDRSIVTVPVAAEQEIYLPASSPYNPFQQDIYVELPTPQLTQRGRTEFESERLQLGLIWRLPNDWSSVAEVMRATTESSTLTRGVDRFGGAGSALAYLASVALIDPNTHPMNDVRDQMDVRSLDFGPARTTLTDSSVRVSGPIAHLPNGEAISVSGLLEYRTQDADGIVSSNDILGPTIFGWKPPASQDVWSAYAEARAPLVTEANALPLMHQLELVASIRHDAYATHTTSSGYPIPSRNGPFPDTTYFDNDVSSTDYTLGLRYSPFNGVTFRASYGTGFLAPDLNQLASIETNFANHTSQTHTFDPRRGNTALSTVPGPYTQFTGGNPDLDPEQSESSSFGIIFEPSVLPGLRLSADYTTIRKTGEIGALDTQFIIDHENEFPGRVVRGPNLPGDPSGWAGPINQVDLTFFNLSSTQVDALDLQVDYGFHNSVGDWRFYVIGTKELTFERQLTSGTSTFDSVGYFDGPLEWRANFGMTFERGGWLAGWNAQYFDAYAISVADPTSQFRNPGYIALQGGTTIPSQTYHDLFVRYRFGQSGVFTLLHDTEISLSIQNALNEEPPVVVSGLEGVNATGGYSTYGDPRLRRFLLTVRRSF